VEPPVVLRVERRVRVLRVERLVRVRHGRGEAPRADKLNAVDDQKEPPELGKVSDRKVRVRARVKVVSDRVPKAPRLRLNRDLSDRARVPQGHPEPAVCRVAIVRAAGPLGPMPRKAQPWPTKS